MQQNYSSKHTVVMLASKAVSTQRLMLNNNYMQQEQEQGSTGACLILYFGLMLLDQLPAPVDIAWIMQQFMLTGPCNKSH